MSQPLDALCECSARCAGKPQGSQTEVTASNDFRFECAIAKADAFAEPDFAPWANKSFPDTRVQLFCQEDFNWRA